MQNSLTLHITPGLGQGGAQSQLLLLCKSNPDSHIVFSLIPNGELLEQFSQSGVEVADVTSNIIFFRLASLLHLISKRRPDLVVGWMYHGCILSIFAKVFFKKKIFWNIRHSMVSLKHESFYSKVSIILCIVFSFIPDLIIYNSRTAKFQHSKLGFKTINTCVIPNGIDLNRFKPSSSSRYSLRNKLNIPDDLFVVGHVARFHPMKNHMGLLNSLNALKNSGRQFVCIMIGTNVVNSRILDYIQQNNLQDNIHLFDRINHIEEFYPSFDLLVLPSLWGEAFPNVIGEAMASGVPVLASDLGDTVYMLGDTGFSFPAGNQPSFINSLLSIIDDRSCLRKCQTLTRKRIAENFSLDSMIQVYSSLIDF